jgi:hypothetical protein
MGVAETTMGHQHESKPVTQADKEMSKRHKKHRAMMAKISDQREQLIASSKYNLPHAAEHLAQHKKNLKALAKLDKKRSKSLARA